LTRAFIITKPIQYLIVLTIKNQLTSQKDELFVINDFQDSNLFINNIEKNDWNNIVLLNKKIEIFPFLKKRGYKEIYLDSDVGFFNYIFFSRLKLNKLNLKINLFEEGIGTYFNENYFYNYFKIIFYKIFGIGTNFGSSIYTSTIYLYKPLDYLALKQRYPKSVIGIKMNIESLYKFNHEYLNKLCNCDKLDPYLKKFTFNNDCIIILGTWIEPYLNLNFLDDNIKKTIQEANLNLTNDCIIIKEHPNVNRRNTIPKFENQFFFNYNTPVEILIYHLLFRFNKIKIIHHESTVAHYVTNSRVTFYNY
jgi:hypothetical protein